MDYRERVIDQRLAELLDAMGGVVLEGARACGKTSTGLQLAKSSIRLDAAPLMVELATLDPRSLLIGDTPRLIDEWQLAPALWNVIRHEIDERQRKGQFILSGSATPPDDVRRHSGAGRLARLQMRTMTLSEAGLSSNQVSLAGLPAMQHLSSVRSQVTYGEMAEIAVRGGWPALLDATTSQAIDYNSSYIADLCSTEVQAAVGVRHDPVRLRRLLASIARNLASSATIAKLTADVDADGAGVDRTTVRMYLDALASVFALEEVPAWTTALRSRTRLRQQAKLHLADASIACAALGITPQRLAGDPEYFGQVFESMAVHDLLVYAEAARGHIYHYRDDVGLEVDAIVEYADGTWAAVEIKLGSSMVEAAERNLLRLRDDRVDTERVGQPVFMAIVTATEYGYTLPSGIHVVPLATLCA